MPIERKLAIPERYDPVTHPRVASFAAQLDDQLDRLKKDIFGLEPRHLEWQPQPGMNTIGMLLAHLAIVDVWWMRLAPKGMQPEEAEVTMKEILGIGMDDDGMPVDPAGGHPPVLAGKTLSDYLRLLDAARAATHQELRQWRDENLAETYAFRDRVISREWTVYHVLEHFCAHYGQILLLKHMMRSAGILPSAPPA